MRMRRIGTRLMTATVAGTLAVLILAAPVFAVDILDDPMQMDERATQLIQASNALCWEMHRYHQQQPDYAESYGAAKELWAQAGQLQAALRDHAVETEVLIQQASEMNRLFSQIEKSLLKWGPGDRSMATANTRSVPRTVVAPGVEVDIPFVGIRVGGPRVVVNDDGPPQLERRRLHANSHGSQRSLERDLLDVKLAMNYLLEDAGITNPTNSSATGTQSEAGPTAPAPKPGLGAADSQKTPTPVTKKPGGTAAPK